MPRNVRTVRRGTRKARSGQRVDSWSRSRPASAAGLPSLADRKVKAKYDTAAVCAMSVSDETCTCGETNTTRLGSPVLSCCYEDILHHSASNDVEQHEKGSRASSRRGERRGPR